MRGASSSYASAPACGYFERIAVTERTSTAEAPRLAASDALWRRAGNPTRYPGSCVASSYGGMRWFTNAIAPSSGAVRARARRASRRRPPARAARLRPDAAAEREERQPSPDRSHDAPRSVPRTQCGHHDGVGSDVVEAVVPHVPLGPGDCAIERRRARDPVADVVGELAQARPCRVALSLGHDGDALGCRAALATRTGVRPRATAV
jgi:hypothetical protein